jgi:hypothetical protein
VGARQRISLRRERKFSRPSPVQLLRVRKHPHPATVKRPSSRTPTAQRPGAVALQGGDRLRPLQRQQRHPAWNYIAKRATDVGLDMAMSLALQALLT